MMKNTPLSFEFFPPKTAEGIANLRETKAKLATFKPEFFSVTFGAGGSTRDRTMDAVFEIQDEGYAAAPHISCISATRDEVSELLKAYQEKGIKRVGDFKYANELVSFIRQETGDWFHIEVAAYPEVHPESASVVSDIANFKRKVDAGANSAITQYFYNADAYFQFLDSCQKAGIKIPIIPGVMPIYNYTQLARFSSMCGAEIPRWLRFRLEAYADDLPSLRAFGIDIISNLCEQLLVAEVPGFHFYTLNQAGVISTIINNVTNK
jgi:methylenetetrahydrofolate reductase (NADPH)